MCRGADPEAQQRIAGKVALKTREAFTLLEVMLAVAIISLVALSIFRFVDSTLRVVAALNSGGDDLEQLETLCRMLQFQLNDLPSAQQGAISGQPHIFNGTPADELQWLSSAGNGLFTAYAAGDYRVTLMIRNDPKTNTPELGLRRVPVSARDANEFNWVPLVPGIKAMESRYFDARLNTWVEKWTDPQARPNLVRLKLWNEEGGDPYEVVLTLPRINTIVNMGGAPNGVPPANPGPRIPGINVGNVGGQK